MAYSQRASSVPLHATPSKVGYAYSLEMMQHADPRGHPEQPERITSIWRALTKAGLVRRMQPLLTRSVKREEALLIHSEDHWEKVKAIQTMTSQQIVDSEAYYDQLSLYVCIRTTESARISCGSVIEACLAVAKGEVEKSLAIVRPPGHHAEPNEHMGFCFFNNVAVAARVVQQKTRVQKILILDWDVHHGNGTQRAFYDDPSVLYMSIHRYEDGEFYPCGQFGSMESCGEGEGAGYSVNIPWPEGGMGDADYILAFQRIIMPIAVEFGPQLVIISAGFDAADGDTLGECHVTPTGYAYMTHMLAGLAGGRLVVALEGGYNLDSISSSMLAVTRVLLGEPPSLLPPMKAGESATETVWQVARQQSRFWSSIHPVSYEPNKEAEDVSFSLLEVIQIQRKHFLHSKCGMVQIPVLSEGDDSPNEAQTMCFPDVLENNTLVVFIHDVGTVLANMESAMSCQIQTQSSYLIDFSKLVVDWVKKEGFCLIDVCLPLFEHSSSRKEFLLYLWDNYIQLSAAENVVFIGLDFACPDLVALLSSRMMEPRVKAVVQVHGHNLKPRSPSGPNLAEWTHKSSLLVLPSSHSVFTSKFQNHLHTYHGTVSVIGMPKGFIAPQAYHHLDVAQCKYLIIQALPGIVAFVKEKLLI